MTKTRLLAFSSSRVGNSGYLETAAPVIHAFLGNAPLKVAFVPFALVDPDHEGYTQKVRDGLAGLPHTFQTVTPANARVLLTGADVIMVGGGNTFKLLHDLYENDLLGLIRERVASGIPYIGWSAGSNVAGASICTSNDMPIIQPERFEALSFLPFQINPHYYNQPIAGFNGETRDQRLAEFLQLNPNMPVLALPEGTALQLEGHALTVIGESEVLLFRWEQDTVSRQVLAAGDDLSFLL